MHFLQYKTRTLSSLKSVKINMSLNEHPYSGSVGNNACDVLGSGAETRCGGARGELGVVNVPTWRWGLDGTGHL